MELEMAMWKLQLAIWKLNMALGKLQMAIWKLQMAIGKWPLGSLKMNILKPKTAKTAKWKFWTPNFPK